MASYALLVIIQKTIEGREYSNFRRIKPQSFPITIDLIAQFLGIPKSMILRSEPWAYIIFVHRRDKGGQFISYRKLKLTD